jgi:hypothetical protein
VTGESAQHLAGRIMRESHSVQMRLRTRGKVLEGTYDHARNVGKFVYELPTGERFEVQIRAWTEVTDD